MATGEPEGTRVEEAELAGHPHPPIRRVSTPSPVAPDGSSSGSANRA
jgi:hypothetical protein